MDYVVFGIGMGASLVLLGLAGRAIGPMLRCRQSRSSQEVLSAVELIAQVAWARFCNALGAAIAFGGMLLLVVTGINMALRVDDEAAALTVGLALFAVVVLMAVWTWAFIGRFGLFGIISHPASTGTSLMPLSDPTGDPDSSDAELDLSFLTDPAPAPVSAPPATDLRQDPPGKRIESTPSASPRSFALRLTRNKVADQNPTSVNPAEKPPRTGLTRREATPITHAASPVEPQVEVGETVETRVALPSVDISRSEIVNPSDAAALERILSESDEPTEIDLDSYLDLEPDQNVPEPPGGVELDDEAETEVERELKPVDGDTSEAEPPQPTIRNSDANG